MPGEALTPYAGLFGKLPAGATVSPAWEGDRLKLDVGMREALRREWNRPVVWPAALILLLLFASAIPAVLSHRRRERMAARPAT